MKIKRAMALLLTLAMLSGCGAADPSYEWEPDQSLRRQIFKDCLAALPKVPQSTVYNDWAEVVEECDGAAYRQSLRLVKR